MSLLLDTVTGPLYQADGNADGPVRKSRMGSLVVTDAHGKYFEAAARGKVYSLSTAYAGVTLVAASAIGQTAWSPAVGIYNPIGSGVNCVILSGLANYISGTPTAGGLVWGFIAPNAGVTAAGGAGAINSGTLVTGTSQAKTFVMSAMTGSTASLMLAPFPVSPFAAAIAATTPLGSFVDISGLFIVPPGGVIGITGTLGTATLVQAFMSWEEVPV